MPVKTQEVSTTELSVIYDLIYDIADRLIKKNNPCNIRTDFYHESFGRTREEKRGICCKHQYYNGFNRLCCGSCQHWENGCTVKCLACKLFICPSWDRCFSLLKNKLDKLRVIAIKYNLPTRKLFTSKEQWLKGM